MRTLLLALAVALVACGQSIAESTSVVCTRGNVNIPCTRAEGATRIEEDGERGWEVVVHMISTDAVVYTDNGHVCSYTLRSCATRICYYYDGANGLMTSEEAMQRCRRS